jgi:tetratricopeptide (TPR) repeat protein
MDTKKDITMLRAQIMYNEGDFKSAAMLYEAEILTSPENALAHEGMAKSYIKLGRYSDAWNEASRALEINPNLLIARLVRCDVLISHNNFTEAEAEIRTVIHFDKSCIHAYERLGNILLLQHKNDEGLSVLRQATELSPKDWLLNYNIAVGLYKAKLYNDSAKHARLAFRFHPTFQTWTWLLQVILEKHRLWFALIAAILALASFMTPNGFALLIIILVLGLPFILNIGMIKYGEKARGLQGLIINLVIAFIWGIAYFYVR